MNTNTMVARDTIDLLELARALWKNILIIALVAVLVGSAAFAYTVFMISPQYQATAAMYVNNSSFSFGEANFSISSGELSASNSLVSVYIYILRSRTTMEEVIRKAELDYSPSTLSGMISTRTFTGTAALEVTVTSKSPSEAELIANTIAKVLPDRISEIVDGSSVRIVDYAIIPAHRSGPNLTMNTAKGVLAGGFLSACVVVLLSLLDEKSRAMITSADELRSMYPDVMILSMIPDMRVSERKHSDYSRYYASYYGESQKKTKEGRKNA